MKAKNISICAASLLLLLGCAVMLGWFLHIPALVQVFPGLVGMVFNTAFLFALIGITLLFANYIPPERYNVVLRIVGIFIAFVAIIILSQHILHYSIGIDEWAIKAWLTDPNPIPGSMAPNSTIAFILSGIVIFFLPIHHKKIINVLVPLFIFIILLIALTGAFIYILKLEYVFSWYNYTRMAVPTTVGFILVSLSSWCLVIQSPHFAHLYEGKEERKIMLLSGAVLVILTLITDLGCIAITTYSSFNLIHESLKISMLNKIAVFEAEIEGVEKNINKLMQNANLQQTVLHASQQETATERQAFALLFSANDIAIKIVGQNGKILYEQGKFNEKPELAIPIKTNYNSTLLWENGFWLRFKVPIYANQQIIGEAIGESPLPIFSKFYLDYSTLGNTGENIICSYKNEKQAQCFPSRLNKLPFTADFTNRILLFPMYYALHGKSGAEDMMDYTRQYAVAAYSPIDATGLGLVVEMDAQEIYKPINKLLMVVFPASFILTLIGFLLLRWQVLPLVRKVINSEKETSRSKIALEHIEKRYEIAVNSSNTGLWEWEKSTDNFYPSDLFKKMLGYNKDEFPNTLATFLAHLHPDDKDRIVELFSDNTINKKIFSIEYRIKNKSGDYGWFQTNGQVIEDDVGKLKGIAGSLLDINERKKSEDLKNEFISVVSHELRTPLTSIRGSLCLVLSGVMGNFSDKANNLLKIANNNCERLINLINDILDVDKLESGKIDMELKPISISKIVKEAMTSNQMYADLFSVRMELAKDLPDSIVNVNYGRLMQVLNNLLSNALKFSPPQQVVSIEIIQVDNMIRVSVSDKGKGISEEFKNRIFKKFSQSDTSSTRKVSGTGLGLNIAKGIIEAMRGKMNFYNNTDQGSTFYFELPISTKASPQEYETINNSQILICEEDAKEAEYIKKIMSHGGYQCDIAKSAMETKAMLKNNFYQVLLIDLHFSDQDGVSLIQDIQKVNTTPIVVISQPDDVIKREILNTDAFTIIDWFEKPLDYHRLLLVLDFIKKDIKPKMCIKG